jgi:membrane protein
MRHELAVLELHRLSWRRLRRGGGRIAQEFAEYDLLTYSSAIAFQALYAVLPLTLVALAALGLAGAQSVFTDHVAPVLRHDLSPQAFAIANRTAMKVMNGKRLFWGTLGVAISLWGLGAALRSMMMPLNGVYGARENRSWVRRLIVSIAAGAGVAVCIYGAVGVALGLRLVHATGAPAVLLAVARWLVALVLLVLANGLVIRAVPARKRPAKWVSVGSAAAVVCWVVATIGFGAYISAVSYSSFYGALGAVVVLLIYVHVAAIAFLLGVVVDSLLREEVTRLERGTRRRGRARSQAGR